MKTMTSTQARVDTREMAMMTSKDHEDCTISIRKTDMSSTIAVQRAEEAGIPIMIGMAVMTEPLES